MKNISFQGGEKRSGNVLELMKEWRNEMSTQSDDDESLLNGNDHPNASSSSASVDSGCPTTNESPAKVM